MSLLLRTWTVSVSEHGTYDFHAASRGKALAQAWRCDFFEGWTFGEFLKHATCRLQPTPWDRFGEKITVAGQPAYLISANKQYVQFARDDSETVLSAHPHEVEDAEGKEWPYWAPRKRKAA